MWCCVPSCENSRENLFSRTSLKSLNVTFHGIPTVSWLRESWLASLDLKENHLPPNALVCSQHFENDDFVSGTRILKSDAVPTNVQFCMICLDIGTKLYPLYKYQLAEAYKNVTGQSLHNMVKCAPKLCSECAHRLINCARFREKSLRAYTLLLQLLEDHEMVTTQNLKSLNRVDNNLRSNLTKKSFNPDHCDLHITHIEEKEKNLASIEIEKILVPVEKTEIKVENDFKESYNSDSDSDGLSNDHIDVVELLKEDADLDISIDKIQNVDTSGSKKVETIKIDKHNIDDFINNEIFTNVEFIDEGAMDLVDESNNKVTSDKSEKNGKVSKSKVSKEANLRQKIDKKKKRVKSAVKGRPGRKPGFKEELKLFSVKELTHDEQLAEILKRKETSNYKNSPFKCTTCYKGFCDTSAYKRHMDKHTNKFGQFACPICGLHTKNTYRVNKHLNNTHAARYNCTLCAFVTRSRNSAKAHERWHDGKKYKCPHCEEEFIKSTSYMSHVRIKHPSDFVCTQCGFSFIGERGLRMHMNMKHRFDATENPDGPLCEECDIRFASETAYHQHMKVSPKHATADTFKLNYPVRKICRQNQPRPTKPTKRDPVPTPKTMGPVDCEQCGVKLKGSRSYAMHFKKYHPDKNRTKFPKARIMCEQCGKIFTCMAHLRYHMPIHAETKQFKCDVCDKRFAFKANLMNHVVIHDSARPRFECAVCGKNFSNQQNRWRHMFLHKGIKFKCEICDKSFNTDPQRALHVAHVHMKVPWPKRNRGPRAKHHVRHAMYASDSQDS